MICSRCRHIFWDHIPSVNDLYEYYEDRYSDEHSQLNIQEENLEYYRNHIRELLSYLNLSASDVAIVDFGCSFPFLLIEARRSGFSDTVGVELDRNACEFGARNGVSMLSPEEFLSNVPDESVGIIRFSHTLEHLTDPVSVLCETTKKLRSGGLAYITQPSYPVFAYAASVMDIEDSIYPEHLHFFSPISLARLVSQAGLTLARFFTHTEENAVLTKYLRHLDTAYSAAQLRGINHTGDLFFGEKANYPFYAGRNSVAYAIK